MSETPQVIVAQPAQVKVTQETTVFEQYIAAIIGLLTAGPLGVIAASYALRGLQGKWAPWTLLGVVSAPICLIIQFMVLGAVANAEPVTLSEVSVYQQQIERIQSASEINTDHIQ